MMEISQMSLLHVEEADCEDVFGDLTGLRSKLDRFLGNEWYISTYLLPNRCCSSLKRDDRV